MNINFTMLDYHQRITEFMTAILVDPDIKTKLEALAGKPFDIQNMTLRDLGYTMALNGTSQQIEDVYWTVGDWKFNFFLEQSPDWIRRHDPNACEFNISVLHRDQWAYRTDFRFDNTKPLNIDASDLRYFVQRFIEAPKRRIAITIREAEKYLADPAYYDTLKTVLKITPRVKKK